MPQDVCLVILFALELLYVGSLWYNLLVSHKNSSVGKMQTVLSVPNLTTEEQAFPLAIFW